jgi:TolB-like protein/tetratricopeptide (TPR) repeat protein
VSLFNELKRRKVFRVAIGYIVAAWVIAQAADLVADNFNAPDWVMQMIITLLIVGLPVSLLLSWAFDLTADGIRRTESGGIEGSLVVSNRSVIALVGGLFVVMAVVFYLVWPRGDRSIAVLPFEDVSPGGDQAYLGIGIADELRLELQHLDGLRVAGRTSSNAYAKEDSKTIGELLNVESILEGSVRKEGGSIRITVQLTNVADGFTIWSQRYNRELDKIFEMQEEIATSVAGSLGVSLGVGGVNAFRGAGTQNVEAYEAYLRAHGKFWTDQEEQNAIPLLERAIELDPNYAVAWSELALRKELVGIWGAGPDAVGEIVGRAHELALRGAQLDPESAGVQSVLALIRMIQFDWISSEQGHTRAIELLADRTIVDRYALLLMRSGRTADAQKQIGIAMTVEPLGGRPPAFSWHASLAQGRLDEAKERKSWYQGNDIAEDNLDMAFNKDDSEALKAAIQALPDTNLSNINLYGPLLTQFDSPERVLSILRDVHRDESLQWPRKLHDIAMAAVYFGDPQFALKVKAEEIRVNPVRMAAIWYPVMSDVRQLPEFKDLAAELNLVEYWRAYGWADHCAPLGDNDFTCT